MVPIYTHADEKRPAISAPANLAPSRGSPSVPLPISRPVWDSRLIATGDAAAVRLTAQAAGQDAGVAPEPDGSGLKSGSAEALAVQLEGAQVVSSEGDVVGQVEKVIDQPAAGRQAVISVGGFLGIGESHILMPAESLVPSGKGMVRTTLTEKQLKRLPAYQM